MTSPYRQPCGISKPVRKVVVPTPYWFNRFRDAGMLFQTILHTVKLHGGPVLSCDDPKMFRVCYVMDHCGMEWWITARDLRRTCPEHLKPYIKTASGRARIGAALSCGSLSPAT